MDEFVFNFKLPKRPTRNTINLFFRVAENWGKFAANKDIHVLFPIKRKQCYLKIVSEIEV